MKHVILIVTCILGMLLTACGNSEVANNSPKTTEAPVITEAPEVTEAPVVTEAPTAEPTEAPTPEPTEEPIEVSLPEDREWIDDLCNKIVNKDIDAVHEILCADDFMDKVAPYRDEKADGMCNEEAYRLFTTDGRVVGVMCYDENGYFSRYAFYSEHEENDYGFKYVVLGDVMVNSHKSVIDDSLQKTWFDGENWYQVNGTHVTKIEEEIFWEW